MADSTAFQAVWPRPQIEASRMACADLAQQRDVAGLPRRPSVASRCSASSCRTVPTRQGTHWPQDSSRKNSAMRSRIAAGHAVVEGQDDAGTERGAGRAGALEGERDVQLVGADERARGAAEQDRLQRAALGHAAGQVEQLAAAWRRTAARRRRAGRTVPETQNSLVPVERAGAGARRTPRAPDQDRQHVDQRLDVVDHGRLAEQALLDGERRLAARLAAVPLDRVEDRGLLTADVRARAAPDLDVEGEPLPHDVLAEQARAPAPVDGAFAAGGSARGYSPRR